MFLSFNLICKCDLYHLGIYYESLFVSSLAVKYYLWKISNQSKASQVSFSILYDFCEKEESESLLSKYKFDFSKGINYPPTEKIVQNKLPMAVTHNKNFKNAHHDIILRSNLGNIPISAKASFVFENSMIVEQQQVTKKLKKDVGLLIVLYLGSLKKEITHQTVAFLDGSGVCNGLSMDMFILVKKLKSLNNQSTSK